MRFNGCTARVPHWLFGTLTVEDWGDHWRFTGRLLGFMAGWFRQKRVPRHLYRDACAPKRMFRYVGTAADTRRRMS